ncbi:MAG: hypothetical protein Q8O47_10990 [Candidatus Bathyarchaeota archaeon]|nr:hypothetical protein [Candidatus Bathyarchaeota archaeon]
MSQLQKKEADTLFELVKEKYGDRVTADELDEMRKGLDAILSAATAMRAVKLENGDEPYQFFKPSQGRNS